MDFVGGEKENYILPAVAVSAFIYLIGLSIYRLYFHPLAQFPGPKLAALTQWYEFYWNVIQPGQFTFHLQDLHDKYGPVVRCNPWELHIRDPDFYETIYSQDGRRDKAEQHVRWAGNTFAAQATVDHDLHKLRRTAQNPFFSKRQILGFIPNIQASVNKMIARLDTEWKGTGKPVVLSDAFGCFTGDMIMEYCFAKHYDFLSAPEFASPFLTSVHELERTTHIMMHFPFLIKILRSLPDFVLPPSAMPIINFERDMAKQIQDLIDDKNQGHKDVSHPTVFRELLDSDLPPQEKTVKRLQDEGVTLIGAGQETNKVALTIAMFHLLRKPALLARLKAEIMTVFPDVEHPPSLSTLEQLPYLTAVWMETLRLSYGTVSRLPRLAPVPITYGPYIIPAKTPLSMNHYSAHHDERVFPDSHAFIPERWLDNPRAPILNTYGTRSEIVPLSEKDSGGGQKGGKLLSRYLVSFNRGTRMCIGMHLAAAESYIMLASVVRRCEFEIFETEWEDVGFMRDYFVPQSKPDARGLRVLVRNVE